MGEESRGCREEPSAVGLMDHRRECESFIGNQGGGENLWYLVPQEGNTGAGGWG